MSPTDKRVASEKLPEDIMTPKQAEKGGGGLTDFLEEEVLFEAAPKRETKEKEQKQATEYHPGDVVSVMVPLPVEEPYSYLVGPDQVVTEGSIVKVPLGPRTVTGIVWDQKEKNDFDPKKLKPLVDVFDVPPIGIDIRRFVDWVSRYTLTSPGLVARMVVRLPAHITPEKPLTGVRFTGEKPKRLTPARDKVFNHLKDGSTWLKSELPHLCDVTPSVIDGLIKAGSLETIALPPPPVAEPLHPDFEPRRLNNGQKQAADILREAIKKGGASVHLIDGVTGSGKTEVYFEAIAEALKKDGDILIMVPEISLTAAFLDRFKNRFGGRPVEWHSDLTPKRREKVWQAIAKGQSRVVVGARSALFLPYSNLKLIIVDEEHDMGYKQEDRAIYGARDMAIVRGHLSKFPVLLASATPSLETFVNVEEGRYQRVTLPGRIDQAALPDLQALDMRSNPPENGRWLAPPLVAALKDTLAAEKQSLLFLNRRGYAPLTLCRQCGFRIQCPNCSTWLVEHRFRNSLDCHHCGYTQKKPNSCSNCGSTDSLVACGPGVERIHEEVQELFPDARSIILSSDMFSTAQRMKEQLAAIERGEADIIIGTQLVSKGHNFPKLAFVGVVDADLGLAHGDMRAAERTFQLLSQVTGRAGRHGGKSLALLQTYAPDHPVMKAIVAGDRDGFYKAEAEQRQKAGLPPYGRLVSFIISGNDKISAMKYGQHLRVSAPHDPRILVLGPSEAPLAVVRGRHRVRLLIQAPKTLDIQGYIRGWLKQAHPPRGGVQLQIDVDPQSFW